MEEIIHKVRVQYGLDAEDDAADAQAETETVSDAGDAASEDNGAQV